MSGEIHTFEVFQVTDYQENIEVSSVNGGSEEEVDFLFYDQENELYTEEGKTNFPD